MNEALQTAAELIAEAQKKGFTVVLTVEAQQVDCKFTLCLTPPPVGKLFTPQTAGGAN